MKNQTTLKLFVIIGVVGLLLLGNGIVFTDIGNLFSGLAFCQPEEEEEPVQARPRPDVMQYQGQQGPSGAQIIGDSGKPKMIGDTGKTKVIGDTGKPGVMDDGEHGTPSVMDDGNHGDGMATMQPAVPTQNIRPASPVQTMQPVIPTQSTKPAAP